MKTVTASYIEGIKEGREVFKAEGMTNAKAHFDNLNATIKGFAASSEVGQLLRGERDFWKNKIAKGA